MEKLSRYGDFAEEKEFARILWAISKIAESDEVKVGDTITWDMPAKDKPAPTVQWDMPAKDKPSPEIEWSFDQKSKMQKIRDKIKSFQGWLKEDDPDIEVKFEHPIIEMLKEFVAKVKDKEKLKAYFARLVDEMKALPEKTKKDLFIRMCLVMAVYMPVNNLITPDLVEKEPILKEVIAEADKAKPEEAPKAPKAKEKTEEKAEKASFDKAQLLVKTAEAGYSDDRDDTGNYFEVPSGGYRFIGTNHGVSAPVLYQYFKQKGIDRLPTKQDMMDLTYEEALEIFKNDYWDKQHLGEINSQAIASLLYDGCINQGPGATIKILAASLENMGKEAPSSWKEVPAAVNSLDNKEETKLFDEIKGERWETYQGAESFWKHGKGWKNRLNALTYDVASNPQKALDDIA
jgi:lysozyme family protein